jgi:hypothetical protein
MKYILIPVREEKECNEILKDAINQGAERGLIMKASFGKDVLKHLDLLMERGYFTAGIVIDSDTDNVEFLFNRHRSQKQSMKLAEFKSDNPLTI